LHVVERHGDPRGRPRGGRHRFGAAARLERGRPSGSPPTRPCGTRDSAFSAALLTATYHDLCVAKEGADTDQIARSSNDLVFD